jgi:hypothetical protein
MPGKRSRLGCDECRGRRRKCDEKKPVCGHCSAYSRTCNYTLKVIWDSTRKQRKGAAPGPRRLYVPANKKEERASQRQADEVRPIEPEAGSTPITFVASPEPEPEETSLIIRRNDPLLSLQLPRSLSNGKLVRPVYNRLLSYFTQDILASLSCHPSVHDDFCRGLIPATLKSPQLLTACLALSAAGFLSRGLSWIDGVEIPRILSHLQSYGIPLLRTALEAGEMNETVVATCLIWCLTDVFTYRQGSSDWRLHLGGIKALLDGSQARRYFATEASSRDSQSAMRHLYLLYLSLQTLPHTPSTPELEALKDSAELVPRASPGWERDQGLITGSSIDGFLGYSEELLHVLQEVNRLSRPEGRMTESALAEADILLGNVNAMIARDTQAPPGVSIVSSLSPEYDREFTLCHMTFQQATLVHVYRRLYHLPSNAEPIQAAVGKISEMICNMTQGQPCHTWVAMAMPLFTMGCEAFTDEQQAFALDKVLKLEVCIGSFHVRTIRQALLDVWRIRREAGDFMGNICAASLLGM